MEKVTGTFIRNYKKQDTGNTVFVYKVTGSPEQLNAYEEAQGERYRVDEETGHVLWFTTRYAGDKVDILINTDNGKIYADMTEFNKVASLTEQFGGEMGKEIARQAVDRLFGKKSSTPEPELKRTGSDKL